MEHDEPVTREPRGEHEDPEAALSSGEVRIDALAAGVVAGREPREVEDRPEAERERFEVGEATQAYELPHWTDPPTGQVPRVLLEHPEATEPVVRGPSWREDPSDWDDALDLSALVPDETELAQIAGAGPSDATAPFSFDFDEPERADRNDEQAWQPLLEEAAATRGRPRRRHARQRRGAAALTSTPAQARNPLLATATGVAFAGVAIACLLAGAPSTLGLVTLVLTISAGEAFAALQRAGFRPATLVGIAAVPALVLSAYLAGPTALLVAFGAFVLACCLWFVAGLSREEPVVDLSVTAFVVAWIGVLGAFGGLLLSPSRFPHRHGVAYVLAAIALTACYDVGAYVVGARFGRRRPFARLSPNKSLEGLAGGTLLCLLVAALGISQLHPLHLSVALELAAVVAVFAPLGDLFESLVKRDLGIKDIGSILPGHGGVLDRVDAMLFVVVPTYCLIVLAHL